MEAQLLRQKSLVRSEDGLNSLAGPWVVEVLVRMVLVLVQMAMRDGTTGNMVGVVKTILTKGGCRTKVGGDRVPRGGTSLIAVIPGGRTETVEIVWVGQEVVAREAMIIEVVHLDGGIDRTAGNLVHRRPRRTWSGSQGTAMWI